MAARPGFAGRDPVMTLRVAVLASGRGSHFQALADAEHARRLPIRLIGLFSDRPDAPVVERARSVGVPVWAERPDRDAPRQDFDRRLFEALAAIQPGLIVCAGYMRIIDGSVLAPWSARMINIHPSLLPRHRGLHTHRRALEAGDREHGASVHFVTAELDGGPVIAQVRVAVEPDDDESSLAAKVLAREHPLLAACVQGIADLRIRLEANDVQVDGCTLDRPLQLDAQDSLVRSA